MKRQNKPPVADSWEDEDLEDARDDNQDAQKPDDNQDAQKPDDTIKHTSSRASENQGGIPIPSSSNNEQPHLSLGTPTAVSGSSPPMSPPEPPNPPPNTRALNSPVSPSQVRSTRPETVSGPAARMIASALGVKPAPRTPEQRAYDKAVKEKEIRRKNEEKEKAKNDAAERERLNKEMWDD